MGLITNKIRSRPSKSPEPTQQELVAHHNYGDDILLDGFLSPLCLPQTRLLELKGSDSIGDMAQKCHISPRELQLMLENDCLAPTCRQLISISQAYDVSVLWLLGYHTRKERRGMGTDAVILDLLGKRDAAESSAMKTTGSSAFDEFCAGIAWKRCQKWNLKISQTISRIIAEENLPLSDTELYMLKGQPVFVRYNPAGSEWGIAGEDSILTLSGNQPIIMNGQTYTAYQTSYQQKVQ